MDNPTVESVFGPPPTWLTNPTGSGPGANGLPVTYAYNPIYFATAHTASVVLLALGGVKIEAVNAISPFGPFIQDQRNLMVRMPVLAADVQAHEKGEPDNNGVPIQTAVDPKDGTVKVAGRLINAGVIANLFTHGYPQSMIDQQISQEVGFEFHWPVTA